MSVNVLNGDNNSAARQRPDAVTWLTGDVTDDRSLLAAIGDQHFDSAASYPVSRRSSLSTERPCG
jgi:hypothetical protein